MRAIIYVKKESLYTGNVSFGVDLQQAHNTGLLSGIDVYVLETKEYVSSYFAQDINRLIRNATWYWSKKAKDGAGYYVSEDFNRKPQ